MDFIKKKNTHIINHCNSRLTLPLPIIDDKTGSRIMVIKQGAYDPNKITIHDVIKVLIN